MSPEQVVKIAQDAWNAARDKIWYEGRGRKGIDKAPPDYETYINSVRDEHKESGWQDIETAPKDGLVDLWWEDRRFTECYRDPVDNGWRCLTVYNQLVFVTKPTHWMQVPPSPPKGPLRNDMQ